MTKATQFTDTTGAVVQAHGGGVIKVGAYVGAGAAAPTATSSPGTAASGIGAHRQFQQCTA